MQEDHLLHTTSTPSSHWRAQRPEGAMLVRAAEKTADGMQEACVSMAVSSGTGSQKPTRHLSF